MNPQSVHSRTKDQLAELLCAKLWKSTIDYVEATHSPQNSYYTTFFWTAFLYSVRDILAQNEIIDEVQNHFVYSVSRLYDIPLLDVEHLAELKKYQKLAYQHLCASHINPCTKEGSADILCISDIISTSEGEEVPKEPPLPEHIMEFMMCVADLTSYTATVLSRTSSPTVAPKVPTASPTKSTARVVKNSRSKKFDWFTLICVAVIVFCLLILALTVPRIINPDQDAALGATPTLAELPRPKNGERFLIPSLQCVSPLSIETTYSGDYYFVLADHGTGSAIMSFYVHAGSSIELDVPIGTFDIYYACGDSWYGTDSLFGPDTTYQKCDESFSFSEFSGWTVQLQPVTYGNLDTEYVSPEDFPK